MTKKALFVCVENAGRSQMAEAFTNLHSKGKVKASSAGTTPSNRVHSLVVKVMMEKGIDITKNKPKLLTTKMLPDADIVIVMGCDAKGFCPAPLLKKVINWELEDPKDKPIEKVRQIRDEIERKVLKLISDLEN
ncbi:MAG: arsenate reductase ArsC [Candidatus Bathyarchaeota archaeon]|nr:arsenate reductase ArsC [Candidatus Bathyarchaeota archaeon]MDH5494085.1 arsenate reductase ArsC [Candidatus Bathyarchaeota archaeon]